MSNLPFAALMTQFRASHPSEGRAAEVLVIGTTTLADYCSGRSLPTANGVKRLAPRLGIAPGALADLVAEQREVAAPLRP